MDQYVSGREGKLYASKCQSRVELRTFMNSRQGHRLHRCLRGAQVVGGGDTQLEN